jgi:hypothetical protein
LEHRQRATRKSTAGALQLPRTVLDIVERQERIAKTPLQPDANVIDGKEDERSKRNAA